MLSVAGLIGTPMRSLYSASKFALDGFGKAIQGELLEKNISVTQIYPMYVRTNISKNALVGKGENFGKTDKNIENGLTVEEACEDMIKAIYLKRFQLIVGSAFYQVAPKLLFLSEILTKYLVANNFK
jgi:short-subunit dehydrogenase